MPALGSGALTGAYRPYRAMAAVYLATYVASAPAAPPTAKLGDSEPATGTWTKMGLLQGDDFAVTTAEATFQEDRRGFKKVLYGRAINQAGSTTFTGMVVESDPDTIGSVIGVSASALTAGDKIGISNDTLYSKSVLIYMKNAFDSTQERYVYIPYGQLSWGLDRGEGDILSMNVKIEALKQDAGGYNCDYELGRFD